MTSVNRSKYTDEDPKKPFLRKTQEDSLKLSQRSIALEDIEKITMYIGNGDNLDRLEE